MRILLDTVTFLWLVSDAPELSDDARELFQDPDNEIYLSSVSTWEIAIKHASTLCASYRFLSRPQSLFPHSESTMG